MIKMRKSLVRKVNNQVNKNSKKLTKKNDRDSFQNGEKLRYQKNQKNPKRHGLVKQFSLTTKKREGNEDQMIKIIASMDTHGGYAM